MPVAWSAGSIPVGTPVATMLTSVPSASGVSCHVIVMVPRERRVVGLELGRLDDALALDQLDERPLDDIGVGRALARTAGWVGECQHHAIAAPDPQVVPLELGGHALWREPSDAGQGIGQ